MKILKRTQYFQLKLLKKFADKPWDQTQDFRDIIAKKRVAKGGFVQNQKEYEINGETILINENETLLQKFHRLQFEVKNFLTEVSDKKAEKSDDSKSHEKPIDPSNIAEELSLLQANLQRIMTDEGSQSVLNPQYDLKQAVSAQSGISKKLMAELKKFESKSTNEKVETSSNSGSVTYELYYSPEQKKQMQAEKIGELEKRLNDLETFLGKSNSNSSILVNVEQLREKLNLLADPNTLDSVQRRVKSLSSELDNVTEKSKGNTQLNQHEKKIEEMFEIMNRWDISSQQLPGIISRLQTLKVLHDESASFLQNITLLENHQQEMKTNLKSNGELMKHLETNFNSNISTISSNVTSIEKKIASLSKKLEELGVETF